MSRNYDNWEKLVEAVLRREKDRQLALFESFSSSVFSSRPSFDSDVSAAAPSSQSNFVSHIQFEEIKLSAQNFHPDMLLGEGRFGPVFKGWIHEHFLTAVKPGSGIAVAIRKLNERETFNLSQPRHPNLVKLIGYSFAEGNRVLVYEFMPNGSLDNHLFIRGHQPLSWETRVKVAIGASTGLSLFHDLKILVTHKGVKSSSILLDDEFNASWSDFDLTAAPNLAEMAYRVSNNDYAAPEYIATGRLTVKSDVYSFGIILLELLCGLRFFDRNRPMKEQNLVVWAKPYLSKERKLLQIVDSRLGDLYPHDEACKFGKLALKCLTLDPKRRPSMTEVVDTLEQFGAHYHQNLTELPTATSLNDSNGVATSATNSSAGFSQIFPGLSDHGVINGEILATPNIKVYSYADLKTATRNFRGDMVLGVGGFGTVYKGWVDEKTILPSRHGTGMMVAIKKRNQESTQDFDGWQAEVDFLGKLSHPNLVKLLGYCLEDQELLLVYEFMAKGSLENHLFRKNATTESLSWEIRLRIAIGAAKGLAFLHSSEKQVIYRDFRASNILLDGSYNAKISDFPLAKLGPAGGNSHVTTRIMATHVYAAPEYISTGHRYVKSYIYGFGVVLLEMLTGLRALDTRRPSGQHNLVDWLKSILSHRGKLKTIMDERIEGQYSSKAAMEAAMLTLRCLEPEPQRRPSMEEAVGILLQISAMG